MAYLPLPNDTQRVFANNRKQSDNAFLLFNRYLEGEGYNFDSFDTKKTKEELYAKIQKINIETAAFANRAEASINRLEKAGFKTRIIKLTSVSRLIVGLGDKNALEVGFTFHPLYGYPYIPGSSLKGLCRSWLEIAENNFGGKELDGDELTRQIRSESREIFGSVSKSETESENKLGDVLFFDAIPTGDTKLAFDVDIMNPHYSPYYSDPQNPPGDWYSPVPIKFLTIREGATFAFFLA
ncbi:MAG: type III-B CRISPR module RAMP protein Cmr6, partial [Balneolales bacterium]|nr:type III-B CRISPR module RAMP protein Cmr6 [Balneolales bacterium]